jgi:flagellin-like hook-associated protein FlgL
MIVNKSMFPLQTGFGVITKMQDRFANLQMQLGTGMKASTLADMGRDLPLSLSVRSRLAKIEGFTANIATVDLRMSFLDKTLSRFDTMESEARNSAVQGQYGTNNINMATLPSLSKARLDELVTLLNSDVNGRYLFGGSNTDSAPVPDTTTLLEGQGGKAGFKAVLSERRAADAGTLGNGRLTTGHTVGTSTVSLAEDGLHPFGMKLSNISTTAPNTALTYTAPVATVPATAKSLEVTFAEVPDLIVAGNTITMGFALPDGTETQITLRAVETAAVPPSVDEFVIGADAETTAINFQATLDAKLNDVASKELSAASNFVASESFFNGPGEPVLRVAGGNPATATALRVADESDTIMWYQGQSPAVAAEGLGRMQIGTTGDTVTLSGDFPLSDNYGFKITGVSADTANIDTTYTAATATEGSTVSFQFDAALAPNEAVNVTLAEPGGGTRTLTLTAVSGKAGAGQFSIGSDANETAANFAKALKLVATEAAIAAEGNPRATVTSQIDDTTRVAYGIEANESGLLRLMRSQASMAVENFLDTDAGTEADSKARYDAMARRQQLQLSESHNSERGSIEILTMELAIARNSLKSATTRHTDYKAQLDNLLSDVETVSKEDVAMEILALQTRLQASYQVTSMVSQLSLSKYM